MGEGDLCRGRRLLRSASIHVNNGFGLGGRQVGETHIVELITVSSPVFIHDAFAIALVAEITALVFEVVFYLLLHIEVVEALHNFKQAVCISKQGVAVNGLFFRCTQVEIEKAQIAAGFPTSIVLLIVVVEELLERYAKQWSSRDVIWECRKIWKGVR
jgi:hypothetical protein